MAIVVHFIYVVVMSINQQDASSEQNSAIHRLNRAWLSAAAIAIVALLVMALFLRIQWVAVTVGRWIIVAGLAIFYELRIFRQTLPFLHRPNERTLAVGVTAGIWLTLLSGLEYALIAGFLLVTQPKGPLGWLPAVLGLVALAADIMAVVIVRRQNQETVGGEQLAWEFRALGMLILTALAIHYGKLNPWLLVIGLMEYLHLFSTSWMRRQKKGLRFPTQQPRIFLLWAYLAALSFSLFPVVSPGYAAILSLIFGLPYFFIALRDWLILVGLLDPNQSQFQQTASAVNQALTGWLALSFRLLGAMAVATVAADLVFHFDDYAAGFSGPLGPGAVLLMLLVALPFLFLGVRARLFALLAFVALSVILLVMGQSLVILAGLLLMGLTIILGQGSLAVDDEESVPSPK